MRVIPEIHRISPNETHLLSIDIGENVGYGETPVLDDVVVLDSSGVDVSATVIKGIPNLVENIVSVTIYNMTENEDYTVYFRYTSGENSFESTLLVKCRVG